MPDDLEALFVRRHTLQQDADEVDARYRFISATSARDSDARGRRERELHSLTLRYRQAEVRIAALDQRIAHVKLDTLPPAMPDDQRAAITAAYEQARAAYDRMITADRARAEQIRQLQSDMRQAGRRAGEARRSLEVVQSRAGQTTRPLLPRDGVLIP